MKLNKKVIALSISFGVIVGIFDTVLDWLIFYEGTFFELLFSNVSIHELYIRTFILIVFIIFGIIMSHALESRKKAEKDAHESREWLKITLHSIGDAVIATDTKGKITLMNPVSENLSGWKLPEAKGKNIEEIFKIINETTRKEVEIPIAKVLRDKKIVGLANYTVLIAKDGTETPIDDSAAPIKDKDGNISGVVLIFKDISERKQAEKEKLESEGIVKTTLKSIYEGILVVDKNGKVIYSNKRFAKMWNISNEIIESKDDDVLLDNVLSQLIYPESFISKVKELYNSDKRDSDILYFKDGRIFERFSTPILQEKIINGRVWSFRDITQKMKTEIEIYESREWLKTTLQSIGDAVIATDTNGKITLMNPVSENLTGWKLTEAEGKNIEEIFKIVNESTREEVEIPIATVLRDKKIVGLANHTILIAKDGNEIPIDDSAAPIKDKDGNISGVVLIFKDISEKKKAEKSLRKETKFNEILINTSPIFIVVISPEGKTIKMNDSMLIELGYSEDEVINTDYLNTFVPKEEHESLSNVFEELIVSHKGTINENRILAKDGKELLVEWHGRPVLNENGELSFFIGIGLDITERRKIEIEIHESREWLQTTLQSIGDAVIATDTNGKITLMNPVSENLTGWKLTEAEGKNIEEIFNIVNESTREEVEIPIATVLRDKKVVGLANHTILISKDGNEIPIDDSAAPIKDKNGNISGVVLIFKDISERKKVEKHILFRLELDKLENEISMSFANASATNIDDTINSTLEKIVQFVGANRSSLFIISEDLESITNTHEWTENPKDSQIEELQNIPFSAFGWHRHQLIQQKTIAISKPDDYPIEAEGEREWIKEHGFRSLLFIPLIKQERVSGALGFYSDIGKDIIWSNEFIVMLKKIGNLILNILERKQAEEAATSLGIIIKESLNEIYIFDSESFEFIFANNGALQNIGYSIEELSTITPLDIKPEFTFEKFTELVQPLHNNEKDKIVFTTIHERKDKSLYDVEVHLQLSVYNGQKVFIAIILDITERKKAEETIRDSEEKYRLLTTNTLDTIWTTDLEFNLTYVNESIFEFLGYSQEEFVGMNPREFTTPESMLKLEQAAAIILSRTEEDKINHLNIEVQQIRKDGKVIDVDISANPIIDEDRNIVGFQGRSVDIGERKKVEIALRESEERYSILIDTMKDGLMQVDNNDTILFVNKSICNMFGYNQDELIGKIGLDTIIYEADKEIVREKNHLRITGVPDNYEIRGRKKSGSIIWLSISGSPLKDKNNNIIGSVGIIKNITERKQVEEEIEKLNEELELKVIERTAELNDAMDELKIENDRRRMIENDLVRYQGELQQSLTKEKELNRLKSAFTSMVSHQYRTPLTVIYTGAELIKKYNKENNSEGIEKHTESIFISVDRMVAMLEKLLLLGKYDIENGNENIQEVNVNEIIIKKIDETEVYDHGNHTFEFNYQDVDCIIETDYFYIEQILDNLISNAVKYSPEKTVIRIETDDQHNYILIKISDEGIGIPKEEQQYIFDHFFKASNAINHFGSGLGLSIVKRFVDNLNGFITIESEIEKGTSFTIRLPKS